MATREELIKAFFEAANPLFKSVDADVEAKQIATAMREYARKHELNLTDEEINATVAEGMEEMAKAGADFSFQNWMMK